MADFEAKIRAFHERWQSLNSKEGESEDTFSQEFASLKTESLSYKEQNTYPAESGLLPVNKKKNRFKDILPFEYTRVQLHSIEGVEGSDYINANYVQGYDGSVTYIAAQGPLPHTVNDFWRMVWYHQIEIVVMACREVEMGKVKCHRYWPDKGESQFFGAINVTTKHEENISNDFIVRELVAECQGEKQVIRQYHYNAWPDHGRPSSPTPIIRMIEMLRYYRKTVDIPVVVHCSAGCGRTGTILAIDIARSMLLNKELPGDLNIYNIVREMRKQRPAMVQAKDQYVFVYLAVAEIISRLLGNTPQPPPKKLNFEKRAEPTQLHSPVELSDGCGTYENWSKNNGSDEQAVTDPEPAPATKPIPAIKVPPKVPGKPKVIPPVQPRPHSRTSSPAMMETTDAPHPPPKPLPRSVSPSILDAKAPPLIVGPKPLSPLTPHKNPPQPAPRASVRRKKDSDTAAAAPTPPAPQPSEPLYSVVNSPKGTSTPTKPDNPANKSLNSTGSRSILETLLDVCDEIDIEQEEKKPLPAPPPVFAKPHLPPVKETMYSVLGVEDAGNTPPTIPRRTADSHIIVDSINPEPSGVPDEGVYELPAAVGVVRPPVTKGPSPPPLPPPCKPSMASVYPIATMRPGQQHQLQEQSSNKPGGAVVASLSKALKNIAKGKQLAVDDKKQHGAGGIRRSASDHGIHSPTTSPSKSGIKNNRFNFSGEMGFGVRITRPKGPRAMPTNWGLPNGLLH